MAAGPGHKEKAWGEVTDDDVDRAQGNWGNWLATFAGEPAKASRMSSKKLTEILDSVSGEDESTETSA